MRRLNYLAIVLVFAILMTSCGGGGSGGEDSTVSNKVTVTGTVLDTAGLPVSGAVVTLYSNPVSTTTDEEGGFSIEVEPGDHTMTVVKGEVTFVERSLTVVPGLDNPIGEVEPTIIYWRDGVQPVVEAPEILPGSGTYTSSRQITIATPTPEADIRYTTDGTDPGPATGILYTGPFTVSSPTTLKAIAYRANWIDSTVSTAAYDITGTVATPAFSPAGGIYSTERSVAITCATDGATIRYTADGSTPTDSYGTIYGGAIAVSSSQTLKAVAYKADWAISSVAAASYEIEGSVAFPTFSPGPGTYAAGQTVTLACATEGATIRYTADGSTPTDSYGTIYGGAITVNSSQTLKAIAYKTGMVASSVAAAAYEIPGIVDTPTFGPEAGAYTTGQFVTIASSTDDTTIRYTTDGTAPTARNGTVYTGALWVNSPQTLNAVAYKAGWATSPVSSASYDITGIVQTPTFSLTTGTYTSEKLVTITSATPGASIVYTLDGKEPYDPSALSYTGPVLVGSSGMLKAVARKTGWITSEIAKVSYVIRAATPTFSPVAGTYTAGQLVTITSATPGATIRYTTDGSTPAPGDGAVYAGPVELGSAQTLKAVAYKGEMEASPVASAPYNVTGTIAPPTFSVGSGHYTASQSVVITTITPGANIVYTTDGSTPNALYSAVYRTPVQINQTQTLKALAFISNVGTSPVSEAAYEITGTVATPKIGPAGGTYTAGQWVTITCDTDGATIRHTDNGSQPTENHGTVYTGPVFVNSSRRLMAVATKPGWAASEVATEPYIFTGTVAAPTFSLPAGTYGSDQRMYITSVTDGASIRYTTDGTTPTQSHGARYDGGLWLSYSQTIKAVAYKAGWATSPVSSADYEILGQVATPSVSPPFGTYTEPQWVTITSATEGASVWYNNDGGYPSGISGNLYTGPIFIDSSTQFRVKAFKDDWDSSYETQGTYVITGTVASPNFSPAAGTYVAGQTVAITTNAAGATIRYTTDGSDPMGTGGTVYAGPIYVGTTETLKAAAYKAGWLTSPVSSSTYKVTGTVATPSFSPAAGNYPPGTIVAISSATDGATIRYTTNGATPTETNGTLYTGPVPVSAPGAIKAVAYKADWAVSQVSEAAYSITGTVSAPTFSPAPGNYGVGQQVALASATEGATIRYTTDGTEPTETHGTVYAGLVAANSSQTIRAVACKAGWATSSVSEAAYEIEGTVANPTFSPAAGVYRTGQAVTITSATEGASIRYTTDGSDPTESTGTQYSGAVSVAASQTLKALAYKTDFTASSISAAAYEITGTVAIPTFSPEAGTYTTEQAVTIATATSGTTIRYTTDGTTPTESHGTLFTVPITIYSSRTLKAVAYKTGWETSSVANATYTVTGKVVAPTFAIVVVNNPTGQLIAIDSPTFGAAIRYTTDGTLPTETNGTPYAGPIALNTPQTLKAVAYKDSWETSEVSTAPHNAIVATPSFSQQAGYYPNPLLVTITCPTIEATIRYTTDGSTPTDSTGTIYAEPVSINAYQTLKAVAYMTGWTTSQIASASYGVKPGEPTFSPPPGTYATGQAVTIASATNGATILYTTDGSTPYAGNGYTYTRPVQVNSTQTLKAEARYNGAYSNLAAAVYTITGTVAAPTFSTPSGTYSTGKTVIIASATSGATIRYTTDGTTPTESHGAIYNLPVLVNSTRTLKAVAYKTDWTTSPVSTADYTITGTVAAPTFSPAAGNYTAAQEVAIASATEGAGIRYTTDGTTPTDRSGTIYVGPIAVASSQTLKTVAYKTNWATSPVSIAAYKFEGSVAPPLFEPPPGVYATVQTVSIISPTEGTAVRYTTDGTTPTESQGTLYTGPVKINSDQTLKAVAYKTGSAASPVTVGEYRLWNTGMAPVFTPAPGTYTTGKWVSISNAQRYTTDGTTPTDSHGFYYTGPIYIYLSTTFKAASAASDAVTTAEYVITGTVGAPTFSPMSGSTSTYPPIVNIGSATPGATIRYTTDGTTPTETVGKIYEPWSSLYAPQTLKAVAYKTGWTTSTVSTATYNFTGKVASPVFSLPSGSYATGQYVSIASPTEGATVKYAIDGDCLYGGNWTTYTAPIWVGESKSICAGADKTGMESANVSSERYQIGGRLAPPYFSRPSGSYPAGREVGIYRQYLDATVRYTTDGSTPTETHGTIYDEPINLVTPITLKAIAYKTDWITSPVATAVYGITGTVEAPRFTPAAGTYTAPQSVAIACWTSGSTIRYTTNGTTPTETSGTIYTGPVQVNASQTLKAVAYKTGWTTSAVAAAAYEITGTVAAPTFAQAAGTYPTPQTITIACGTSGATIRYTTDGNTPTASYGTVYTGPVQVNTTRTIKAIAYKTGWTTSQVSAAYYNIEGTVAVPTFDPPPGDYPSGQLIAIACATDGADIRYTTDGTTPTETTGTPYAGAQTLNAAQTLKAVAYKAGASTSIIATAAYRPMAAMPTFSLEPGTYTAGSQVTIASDTDGAVIRYTTDGTTPTQIVGNRYTGPITLDSTMTLKAVAFKTDWATSAVAAVAYNIMGITAKPTFSAATGIYPAGKLITIASSTSGAAIRYTTDGSTPTETTGTLYAGAITLNNPQTIKAIAYKADWATSAVATATYKTMVESPTFSPEAGTYSTWQTVAITSNTDGATIRYTTDGTIPTQTYGTVFTQPIFVSSFLTLRVIAYKTDWADSLPAWATYIFGPEDYPPWTIISGIGVYDAKTVELEGDRAYVPTITNGLSIIDLSAPLYPAQLGTIQSSYPGQTSSGTISAVQVLENTAFVELRNNCTGLLLDTGSLAVPDEAASYSASSSTITVISPCDEYYGHLRIYDVSDPANPLLFGTKPAVRNILLDEATMYFLSSDSTYYFGSRPNFNIMDVSDPMVPTVLGTTEIDSFGSLAAENGIVWMSQPSYGGLAGLQPIDITDETNPQKIGPIVPRTYGTIPPLAVANGIGYIADGDQINGYNSITVFDATAPESIAVLTSIPMPYGLNNISAADGYLYAATDYGVDIFDVSLPDAPLYVRTIETDAIAQAVAVSGKLGTIITAAETYRPAQLYIFTLPTE